MGPLAGAVCCAVVLQFAAAEVAQTKVHVLHSFAGNTDGRKPRAALIDVNGILYGTTEKGGTGNCSQGCGTVYALDPKTGADTVLYSFCGQQNCSDGSVPQSSLIDVNGTLYGTTYRGGGHRHGTVFALDPNTGIETVLYSFCSQKSCTDGSFPQSNLIDVNGALYGTTIDGGNYNCSCGTVFRLDPNTDVETVLYRFCSQQNCTDGQNLYAGLLNLGNMLYGTAGSGGTYGYGTVFALDPSTGAETVLYSFCSQQNCKDGRGPSNLIDVHGTLYGTTVYGGAACSDDLDGCGTVFALDRKTGIETVLYVFCSQQNCTDGAEPFAGLIDVKGILYGTTRSGGAGDWGTVFELDPNTDVEAVLYSFCSQQKCADGSEPFAGLIDEKDLLYGTTYLGGADRRGTVFVLKF